MKSRKLLLFTLSIISSVFLSGCGSDDDSSSSNSVTFKGITYTAVKSSATGKTWLDKNLGASQVCTSKTDSECYGDYYQWGRETDGHEKNTSTVITSQVAVTTNAGSNFLAGSSDWSTIDTNGSTRQANWAKTDGSAICPSGYRVPTVTELQDELSSTAPYDDSNFATDLKLALTGYRLYGSGNSYEIAIKGAYWSQTPDSNLSKVIFFTSEESATSSAERAYGVPVRCIKN